MYREAQKPKPCMHLWARQGNYWVCTRCHRGPNELEALMLERGMLRREETA